MTYIKQNNKGNWETWVNNYTQVTRYLPISYMSRHSLRHNSPVVLSAAGYVIL